MEQRVRDSFASQDFMRTLGATLISMTRGAVELRLPIRPGVFQQHGFVHAGAVSAIADTAAGYAAISVLKDGAEVLTVEFKINLLAPAHREYLVARARVARSGRQITVSACDAFGLTGSEEECVATLLATVAQRP
jgi:uncharacterized protein (TIGR00369 family)